MDSNSRSIATIDESSPIPLYSQLQQILLCRIQNGEFAPDDTFPSERELEEKYAISRITVRRALSELEAGGYLSRKAGRRTFVINRKFQTFTGKLGGIFEDLAAQGFQVQSKILELKKLIAPHKVALILHVPDDRPVIYFKRLVLVSGEPIGLTHFYLHVTEPITLTRAELETGSVFPLLEKKYAIVLKRARQTIEATMPLEEECELLHLSANVPVLLIESVSCDANDQPASFGKTIYRGDKYRHYIEATR